MQVLVIDTSTPAVATAVVDMSSGRVRPLASRSTVDARAHGELLGPSIAAVLAESGVPRSGLSAIVAGTGPGPFTGLRVGLVTAATMGQALDLPTYGVCSLDALGAVAGGPEPVLVATDARRREVYWAVYAPDGRRLTDPAVDQPVVAAKEAARLGATVAVGEGAHRYAAALGLEVRDQPQYPAPAALAELASERVHAHAPGERLVPLYLRRPDVAEPRPPKPATARRDPRTEDRLEGQGPGPDTGRGPDE